MSNNRDGFYCSQPAPKSATLADDIWRRLRRPSVADKPSSSSSKPTGENEAQIAEGNPQETDDTKSW